MKKDFSFYYLVGICLLIFVELVFPKMIVLPILFMVIALIVGGIKRELQFQFHLPLLLLALLYLAYLFGSYFTFRPDLASKYIEYKLSFLLFPILFSWVPKKKYSIQIIPVVLTVSILLISFVGITGSINCFTFPKRSLACFFSSYFSSIHHPSYYSMFILLSGFFNWFAWRNRWNYFNLKWLVPITIYYLFIYFLCLSLAGLLFLMLFGGVLLARFIYRKYGKKLFFLSLLVIPTLFILSLRSIPKYQLEINSTIRAVKVFINNPQTVFVQRTHKTTGNEARLMMWVVSYETIKNYPLGVGTGNLEDYLHKGLLQHGQGRLAQKNYNPHNQFLQTGAEIGLIGLLILVLFLFFTIQHALRSKNYFLLVLCAVLIFNSFFESVLQRQSGIVFFSLVICFMVSYTWREKDEINILQ